MIVLVVAMVVSVSTLLPAGAAERGVANATVVDLGRLEGNLDSYGWQADRACGYSEPLPESPGNSLWVFCETDVTRPDGSKYQLPSSAAIGPDTPGGAPDQLTDVGYLGVPTQFLPPADDFTCSEPSTKPTRVNGMVRVPKTTRVLITYTALCVGGPETTETTRRSRIAEYNLGTGEVVSDTVLRASSGGLPSKVLLGTPVIKGAYLYLYSSKCTVGEYSLGLGCDSGGVFVARVALGRNPEATRPWADPSRYRWWSGKAWVADDTAAASIARPRTQEADGVGPLEVSVDWYPQRNRYVMVEKWNILGGVQIWDAKNPRGPWTLRAKASMPSTCVTAITPGRFCRSMIGHPELTISPTSVAVSYYDIGDGRVHVAMINDVPLK